MKIFKILLTTIAIALLIFNATKLNFKALFEGESLIALITIVALFCVILLLQILRVSKRIERLDKTKE